MYKTTPRLTRFINRPISSGQIRFYSDSKKEQIMKEFEIEDARMKMQKSTKFEQANMEEFDSFKDWFPHSNFCMAGGLQDSLVAGRVVAKSGTDQGFFFVDWGFKFPVRCSYRRPEIDEVPDFENFTMAEKKNVLSAKKEKNYAKIDNLTSTVFNEHLAESGNFSLITKFLTM